MTNKNIVWSLDTDNTNTSATVYGNMFRATTAGEAKVLATIVNVKINGTDAGVATNVATNGKIFITFDKGMLSGGGTVTLNDDIVITSGSWGNDTYTVNYSGLENNTEYTVNISGFKAQNGSTEMLPDNSVKFTTVAVPGDNIGGYPGW